jgi:hypothetical protein
MKSMIFAIVLFAFWYYGVHGKSGEEIADALYQHPNECKDPSDGGIWAPLQGDNPACGAKSCSYPKQWCSATSDPAKSQSQPTLNCVDLPPDCQKVLQNADTTTAGPAATAATTASTAGASAETTTQATTASSGASSTQATTQAAASSKAAGSAAPGASTAAPGASGGCKDAHEYCCFWASKNQCNSNPKWMRTNCQTSCGTCGCQEKDFQTCQVKINVNGCKWNKVRVPLSGGNRLAAFGFSNSGASGTSGSSSGMQQQQQSNKVRIPLGGGPSPLARFGFSNNNNNNGSSSAGSPGSSPMGAGSSQPGNSQSGNQGNQGNQGGKPSSIVTIPVGRKRRHFLSGWFN